MSQEGRWCALASLCVWYRGMSVKGEAVGEFPTAVVLTKVVIATLVASIVVSVVVAGNVGTSGVPAGIVIGCHMQAPKEVYLEICCWKKEVR